MNDEGPWRHSDLGDMPKIQPPNIIQALPASVSPVSPRRRDIPVTRLLVRHRRESS